MKPSVFVLTFAVAMFLALTTRVARYGSFEMFMARASAGEILLLNALTFAALMIAMGAMGV